MWSTDFSTYCAPNLIIKQRCFKYSWEYECQNKVECTITSNNIETLLVQCFLGLLMANPLGNLFLMIKLGRLISCKDENDGNNYSMTSLLLMTYQIN